MNFKTFPIFFIICFCFFNPKILGQDSTSIVNDVSKQVDIKDFIRTIFTKKEIAESDSSKKSIAKEDSTMKKSLGLFYTPVAYPGYSLVSGFLVGVWDVNNSTGRGYLEGRFRGRNSFYFETEYRFNITKKRFLGGVIFTNLASFSEPITNKFEKLNIAYGAGLRVKLNKHAKTNLTIDYGIGQGGSKGFSFGLNENF